MAKNPAASYRENGYVVVRDFFPRPLVEDYLKFLQEVLRDEVLPMFARAGLAFETPNLAERIVALIAQGAVADASVRQVLLGHFPLSARLSRRIEPIARHLGRSALMREVVGSGPLFMHMPPMARFVPPRYVPAAVPAHQDMSYNSHLSDFVTVWAPLVPIDHECGGLVVFEGSHHGPIQAVAGDASGWLRPVATDGYPPRQLVDMDIGDVVILSPTVVHASAPNVSSRIRISMDLRIFSAHARSTKHYMNLDTLEIIPA